uniref:Protein DBF4 homolog A n=1 Tax=Callorhinchus milii TaxID=7868 RepID=V9KES4_CALMI
MKPGSNSAETKIQSNTFGAHGKQGKIKATLKTLQRGTNKGDSKLKPFAGKVFYLDLPSNKYTENLEKDLQNLGGTIEKFLSKDISYIISNRKEAKFVQAAGKNSPVPSPDSVQNAGNTSPHPSSRRDSYEGSTHKTLATISRGKSLVKKVIKEQELIPGNSILSNALAWGVRILYIEDVKIYIARKKVASGANPASAVKGENCNQTAQATRYRTKAGRLKKPFIKVEDITRYYRPFYHQFDCYPEINYHGPNPCSPFDVEKKNKSGDKQNKGKTRSKHHEMSCSEKNRRMERKIMETLKEKKKRGYCECCTVKYDDLKAHLKSEQHKTFSQSTEFNVVDQITSQFDCDFEEFPKVKMKRVKCSVDVNNQVFTVAEMHEEFQRSYKEYVAGTRSGISWSLKKNELVSGWEKKTSNLTVQEKETIFSRTSQTNLNLHLSTQGQPSISDLEVKSFSVDSKICEEGAVNSENTRKNITPHSSWSVCQRPEGSSIISKLCTSRKLCSIRTLSEKEKSQSFTEESSRKLPFDDDVHGCMLKKDTNICSGSRESELRLQTLAKHYLPQNHKEIESPALHFSKNSTIDPTSSAPIEDTYAGLQMELDFGKDNRLEQREEFVNEIAPPLQSTPQKQTEASSNPNTADTSFCMKLHRRVTFSSVYGRNKKALKDKVELRKLAIKNRETENVASPSLPMKKMLKLFQTSEESGSEFGGFADHSAQKLSETESDLCHNQPEDVMSLFAQTSSLSSFLGF